MNTKEVTKLAGTYLLIFLLNQLSPSRYTNGHMIGFESRLLYHIITVGGYVCWP